MLCPTESELALAIEAAANEAFTTLFRRCQEHFYYCSLVTTGEAQPPVVAAWSEEALITAAASANGPANDQRLLRWSSADSPYFDFGHEYFSNVRRLFAARPKMTVQLSDCEWVSEFETRVAAMESAMSRLDGRGVFGTGLKRLNTVVMVEVVPPDHTNTERALRLNPAKALVRWLEEAAEK